jgi:membrane-associated phospholipid phosphatase
MVTLAAHIVVAYVAISAVLIGLGFLLTRVLGSVTGWDDRATRVLSQHRTGLWDTVANAGTFLASTLGITVVAALITLSLLACGAGRAAMLVLYGLAIEFTAFLTVNYVVARPRPSVPHLESTPSTYSFPSGHSAATFVLYGGLAVATSWLVDNRTVAVVMWALAGVVTAWVGVSRVYAGEHHPTDVVAGVLLGAAALGAAVMTVRASYRVDRPTDHAAGSLTGGTESDRDHGLVGNAPSAGRSRLVDTPK